MRHSRSKDKQAYKEAGYFVEIADPSQLASSSLPTFLFCFVFLSLLKILTSEEGPGKGENEFIFKDISSEA